MKWRTVRSLDEKKIILYCDDLVKIYQSDGVEVMALQGLELEIFRGEILAIIGKSGSGKSTLLNVLGGLERPTAGKLYLEEQSVFDQKRADLVRYRYETVGFVRQTAEDNLFPYLTALENVEAPMMAASGRKGKGGAGERRKRAMALLTLVGIGEKADSYPAQLSGGQAQRVAIAAALANMPKILLADEPTGAVDTQTSHEILTVFQRLREELGLTIIIVTHDQRLARDVDRVLMISDGKISTEQHRRQEDIYSVLDKAGRIKLDDEILEKAGIYDKRVKVEVREGKIILSGVRQDEDNEERKGL